MSGHTDPSRIEAVIEQQGTRFLAKPWSPVYLLRAVETLSEER